MHSKQLSTRIVGILIVFFLTAVAAIGMSLSISRQLDGGAAAINDAGSQRMRSYRLAFLVGRLADPTADRVALHAAITGELARFEEVMARLEQGDPARPLFLPQTSAIGQLLRDMRNEWTTVIRPRVERRLAMSDGTAGNPPVESLAAPVDAFVALIDRLVVEVETRNAESTALLRSLQIGLIALAIIGTMILIAFFSVMVIRPVEALRRSIRRMAEADFAVRLPIRRNDEFGELADGFNRMADHLEDLYTGLERRVEEKTRDIQQKHDELAALYEITRSLNQAAPLDVVCRGVIDRIMLLLDAEGGLIRYARPGEGEVMLMAETADSDHRIERQPSQPAIQRRCERPDRPLHDPTFRLRLGVQRNLSVDGQVCAREMAIGNCACGQALQAGEPVFTDGQDAGDCSVRLGFCQTNGYTSMVAVPIRSKQQSLGVLNLFFRGTRQLSQSEMRLLETVGQNLGTAVENQRLAARDKEMAVYEERNLLAEELHDSIAQSLAFLNIQAQLLQASLQQADMTQAQSELAHMREGIQESYDDVRELLVHFRTRVDRHADLAAAIGSALEKFEAQTGIATSLHCESPTWDTQALHNVQILHIVQESLSNVRKHAAATSVEVRLAMSPAPVIRISDNGRGFDPSLVPSEDHVGLKIMRERAHRIGGSLDVRSARGAGTTVSLLLAAASA